MSDNALPFEVGTSFEHGEVSGNLRLRTQTAPLYIFAQFEAGNIASANAVAAVLAVLSFVIFFFLLRYAARPTRAS